MQHSCYNEGMLRNTLVVAALLLTNLITQAITQAAAAAEIPEQPSKNAQKVLDTLNTLGINDPDIKEFILDVDAHRGNGYKLAEDNVIGGELSIRYQFDQDTTDTHHRLQLVYTPKDSHIQCTASGHGVMIGYHLKLN